MTHDPHPWAIDLSSLHAQVWARLVRGVKDRRAATRHPTLATVSVEGRPKARTVVLRAVDPKAKTIDIHTDIHAAKVAQLRANPFAALHVWDETARLQMRIECQATILSGPDVTDEWARVSPQSQTAYGSTPIPGSPIDDALAYTKTPDRASFAIVRLAISTLEVLHLGPQHRRARFEGYNDWHGQWLVP